MPHTPPKTIVFDTETTGLSKSAEVISIAFVSVESGDEFHTLVRPTRSIDERATAIHGLTDEDLADAPTWKAASAAIRQFLAASRPYRLAAHNLSFDLRMIAQTDEANGTPPLLNQSAIRDAVCTLRLARKSVKASAGSTKLGALFLAATGRDLADAHDALVDARALAEVIRAGVV